VRARSRFSAAVLRHLIVAGAVVCFTAPAGAELPPAAYRQQQSTAPEFLEIKVRSVKTREKKEAGAALIENNVEADVRKIRRTAGGLQPGATIKIRYTQRIPNQPMAGPSQLPTLKKGQVYPAYLRREKDNKAYAPAAGGYSFETVARG